jgi:glucose uptake protein GlcU
MKRLFWNTIAFIALVVIVVGIIFSSSANALRKDAPPAKPAGPSDHGASASSVK